MTKPKRAYEMVISLGADTVLDICSSLKDIVSNIHWKIGMGTLEDKNEVISGGYNDGYCYSLIKTDTVDHEDYFKQLQEMLKKE